MERCARRAGQLVAALLLAVSWPANAAQAQEPAGYSALIDEALDEYEGAHFAEARALFVRAHALFPNARTCRGLGMVEFELRNYGTSAHWLELALSSTVKPLDGSLRVETEGLLERARGFLGHFTVVMRTTNARLLVDGAPIELRGDHTLELEVGDHRLEVRAPGRASDQRTLRVTGGEWRTLEIDLPEQSRLTPTPTRTMPRADRDDEGGSVLSSPWFWVAVGAVAIGAGVGTGIALGSDGGSREQKPYGGDTDVVLSGP